MDKDFLKTWLLLFIGTLAWFLSAALFVGVTVYLVVEVHLLAAMGFVIIFLSATISFALAEALRHG